MLIGNKIYELRKRMKMSQEGLADKLNVSRQTVSNWETDQTVPDLYQAKAIADNFNIKIDDLFNDKPLDISKDTDMNISEVWNKIKINLLKNISKMSYEVWFEEINKAEIINNEFCIYTKMKYECKHINENYQEVLLNLINEHYSKNIKKVKAILEEKTQKV